MAPLELNYTLNKIEYTANKVLELCKNRYFFAFYGEVGSGKTTMIKSICMLLGSKDTFSSPTYALVNEYSLPPGMKKEKIFHIDLYRLKNPEEALDIDIESYFYNENAFVFVEWPEMLEFLFPQKAVSLYFTKRNALERNVKIIHNE
ncbi:MAG: tRNA (adenosine(37)-N6)-threonylcarbamoyltransferase complex ATPase subunit type 1 TsaE [Chitinophagales bacterium]